MGALHSCGASGRVQASESRESAGEISQGVLFLLTSVKALRLDYGTHVCQGRLAEETAHEVCSDAAPANEAEGTQRMRRRR